MPPDAFWRALQMVWRLQKTLESSAYWFQRADGTEGYLPEIKPSSNTTHITNTANNSRNHIIPIQVGESHAEQRPVQASQSK